MMYMQHRRSRARSYRRGYYSLLAFVLLSPLVLVGAISQPAHAASSGDLLNDVPVVDENTLNNAACGVAAATMVLDYYLPQSGSIHQAIDITAVSQYVKEYYGYDAKTNKLVPEGTTYDQLQTGIEAVSIAPELHFGVPLKASWHATDSTNWFSVLTSELDAKRPIILFLANGRTLGWKWDYGHFIVVSGYTSDNSIIYHDPWDGKPHLMSKDAFAVTWGNTWDGNAAWQYMQVFSSTMMTPTPTPSSASTPSPRPTETPIPTPTDTPIPTPTLTPTPTTPAALSSGTWQGQGTFNDGRAPFDMTLMITVNGNSFSGTLRENVYSTTVNITGSINGDTISFTDTSYVSGDKIQLNCTYTGAVSNSSISGTWVYPNPQNGGGTFSLSFTS